MNTNLNPRLILHQSTVYYGTLWKRQQQRKKEQYSRAKSSIVASKRYVIIIESDMGDINLHGL